MKMSKIRKRTPKQGGGDGHKTNWLQLLKNSLAAIVADTGELQVSLAEGGFTDLLIDAIKTETALIVADTSEVQVSLADGGFTDLLIDAIATDAGAIKTSLAEGGFTDLLIDAIKAETVLIVADTSELQVSLADGGFTDLLIDAITADTDEIQISLADGGFTDLLIDAIKTETALIVADTSELQVSLADGGFTDLLIDAITTHLTDIKGVGWDTQTLVAIKAAIDGIAGVNTYQEIIPDIHILLEAIDKTLSDDPPGADEENSVVDIDAVGDATFVLRSLIINVTGFGTDATKLTFGLWVPVNGTILEVDTVEVTDTGYQNLMDLFGLPEVHADSIHITVISDGDTADASIAGTYKYAKANS